MFNHVRLKLHFIGIYLLNQLGLLSVSTVLAVINQTFREKYKLTCWKDYQEARSVVNESYFEVNQIFLSKMFLSFIDVFKISK